MPTANAGAPPVRLKSVCSPTACASACMSAAVTGNPQLVMVAVAAAGSLAHNPGRTVDGEIHSRLQHAGGDHGHDRDHRFRHHGAIADHARLGLAGNQLRRGAAGNQRMKAADRAAGDGDEGERKNLSREHRPGAIDEAREAPACAAWDAARRIPIASRPIVPSFTNVLR